MIRNIQLLLIIAFCFLFNPTAYAVFGASISYECLGTNTYEVTLTAYQDCNASPLLITGQNLNWMGACAPSSGIIGLTLVSQTDITPTCLSSTSSCNGGTGSKGVEEYIYTGTLTLPANCNAATIYWQYCCRNNTITTFNSTPAGLYVYAEVNNGAGLCNNSVEFLNDPKIIGDRNDLYFYNNGAIDIDGDSLVYSLVDCQENIGVVVDYDMAAGYSGTNPINAGSGISLDTETGQIRFGITPPPNQRAVICVLVEEYRGNIRVGAVVRDIQYESRSNSSNDIPVISGINASSGYITTATVGTPLSFFIEGTDPNSLDNVTMDWDNGISGATFSVSTGAMTNAVQGNFDWTPMPADAGKSHFFRVMISDDNCPLNSRSSYAYRIHVPPLPPSSGGVDAGEDTTICTGGQALLNATTSAPNVQSIEWTPAIGLSNPNIANPIATPTVNTYYTVTFNYSTGPPETDEILVIVEDPIIDVLPRVIDVCAGGAVSLIGGVNRNGLNFAWTDLNTTAPSHPIFPNGSSGVVNGTTSRLDFNMYPNPGNYKFALKAQTSSGFCTVEDSVEVIVNPPPQGGVVCSELYVTTTGVSTASGTKSNPITLAEAMRRAVCGNVVIKIAGGIYILNQPLNLSNDITLEGGFLPSFGWKKTSLEGETVLVRSTANPEGTPNRNQRLVAVQAIGVRGFRLQDLTIGTDDAPSGSGISTYGLYLNGAEDYHITRVGAYGGDAGEGVDGVTGCGRSGIGIPGLSDMDGENGILGDPGSLLNVFADGGNGGAGGGSNGICALPPPPPASLGGIFLNSNGSNGASAIPANTHGGAGGGGGGGSVAVAGLAGQGGNGGAGGGPNGNGVNTIGGAGGNTPLLGLGTSGADGIPGNDGVGGVDGPDADDGRHIGGFFEIGSGRNGQDGQGGDGGSGGGGGGMRLALQNRGNGGGGGGAGGAGGFAGSGGFGGGASFGIYITNNGPAGFIEDCLVEAGESGEGGEGGDGGEGGFGGFGGLGGTAFPSQLAFGGDGGEGGEGGEGGKGGDGADGISIDIFWDGSGLIPVEQDSTFDLGDQPEIIVDDINCTNSLTRYENVDILNGVGNTNWNFDLATNSTAIPFSSSNNPGQTSYLVPGRYTIENGTGALGGEIYTGFHNVPFSGPMQPTLTINNATAIGIQDTFYICVGDTPVFSSSNTTSTNHWDFHGALPVNPGNVAGILGSAFNAPGFYPIELYASTACCVSTRDTIWLHVVPRPTVVQPVVGSVCLGDSVGIKLDGLTSLDTVEWSASTNAIQITVDSFVIIPSGTTSSAATISRKLISGGITYYTCPINIAIQITVAPQITASIASQIDVTCVGGSTGAVTVRAVGAPVGSSYFYQWDAAANGQTTASITGLAAGTYCVTVSTVSFSCPDSICVTIQEPSLPVFINTITATSACNGGNGTTTAQAQGGTPHSSGAAYSYVWSNGQTGPMATALAAGKYYVTATDSLGCEGIDSIVVNGPPVLTMNTGIIVCNGDSSGTLTVVPTGGTVGYTYLWDAAANNQTTATAIGLKANILYCVIVTDGDGCVRTSCARLTEPPRLSLGVTIANTISCNGANDGQINTSSSGGAGGTTYLWSNGQTGPSATNLGPGTYIVTITDNNGCTVIDSATLTEPPALVLSTIGTPISCNSSNDGIARAFVTGGVPGYTFLWGANTGNQTTDFATGLSFGTYCVTVTDATGCIDTSCTTIPPTITNFVAGGDTTICGGDTVQLTASTAVNYIWTPSNSVNIGNIQNPLAFPATTTKYYVTADSLSGVNIIYNGDFEDGDVGFYSSYTYGTGGSHGILTNEGTYAVDDNARDAHRNFAACGDHTSGTGNYMVVNGSRVINQNVWCQTVNVGPNTNYQFSTWVTSVISRNPANLQFSINGVNIGTPFTATSTTCQWNQFFAVWNSGASTTATICINNQNTANSGNDFGLDDIEFIPICRLIDSVTVNVNPTPTATISSNTPNCTNDTTLLIASSACDSLYFNGPMSSIGTTDSFLFVYPFTPNHGTGLWTLSCIDTTTGCRSESAPVFVNTQPAPLLPVVNNLSPLCAGDSAILIAPNILGVTNEWFADSNKTLSLGVFDTLIRTNLLTNDTVYLEQTVGTCSSPIGQVITIINPRPSIPNITINSPVCEGGLLQFSTSSLASNYEWTHEFNGFVSTQQNPSIQPVTASNAGQYALLVSNSFGCTSDTSFTTVVVNSSPTPPFTSTNSPLCDGDSILLTVSSVCDSIFWTSPLGNQYVTSAPNLGIDTNSVDYVNGAWSIICANAIGCQSLPTIDSILIRPQPIFPRIQGPDTVCIGQDAQMRVYPVFGASYAWETASNVLLGTNRGQLFLNITRDTTFYLTITVNGCSKQDSADVKVYPAPLAPIPPDTIHVCEGDLLQATTVSPALAYQWISPAGDTSTSATPRNLSVSMQDSGTYILTIRDLNGCVSPDTTFEVVVHALPNPPTIFDNNPCNGDSLIMTATGGDNYQWTSSTGTVFIGDTLVVLFGSNDYTASWDVIGLDSSTSCLSLPTNYTPSIRPIPNQPFISSNGPVCVGDSVRLFTPAIAGASYTWVALPSLIPVGTNSNDINVHNITNNSLFGLEVNLNGCLDSGSIQVLVHRQLPAPDVPDTIMVCEGNDLFLNTTTFVPLGMNYNWTGPASFSSNQQNPIVFSVTSLNTGFYTLEVIDTTGCPSLDTSTLVIVNQPGIAPSISSPNPSFCDGDSLILIASNTCDSMVWVNPLNQLISGGDTLVVIETDSNYIAGDWSLICIDAAGCQSISNTITLTIRTRPNRPIITHNGPLCAGDDLNLSMALVSGASYEWYTFNPTTLLDVTPNLTIPGITATTVFYGVVTVNACEAFDSVTVQVIPQPLPPNVGAISDTICASDSLRLTTNTGAFAYNWTGPNGFVSTQQNPVVAVNESDTGFYVLTVLSNFLGCETKDSIRIQINALPNPPTITTASNICDGDSINLEGGACDISRWFSPIGTTLDIYGVSTLIIPIDSAEYISGTWQVICIDTTTGCISDTSAPANITINTLPASLFPTNSGPICENDIATLSVPQQGALTYEWSTDRLFTNIFQTGHVVTTGILNNDTTFYVRGTTIGGCTKIDSTRVLVAPSLAAPNIFAVNNLLCEGDSILLGTNSAPYIYHWTGPNNFVSNDQFPLVVTATTADSGLYTLHIEDSIGCVSPDASIHISVNVAPYTGLTILTPTLVCDGVPITLTTAGTVCDSSIWVGPIQLQGGIQNTTTILPGDSNYVNGPWQLICYDTLTGCMATSNTVFVNIDPIPPMPIATNNGSVCIGDSVELSTAISLGTISIWYSDSLLTNVVDTGRVISVGGIFTDTTFYVQQVSPNGCLSPIASTTVTLHPTITPVVYQDTVEVCVGEDIQLGVLTNGISYSWTGPSPYTSTLQNPIINNASITDAGLYIVSIIDNNACPSLVDTITVLVNDNPISPTISYTNPVCDGDNLLIDANPSCDIYQFTGPSGASYTASSIPVVIPSTHPDYQDGTWQLLCINATTGCQTLSNSLTVDITERPLAGIITNSGPVCIGNSVTLSTTTISGASAYNWLLSPTGNSIGSGLSITVPNIISSKTFYLEVITSNGCIFLLDSTVVNVFAPAAVPSISSNAPICEGDTLFLSSGTLAPIYNWNGPNGFVSNLQNPIIFGASNSIDSGLYTLSIVDTNACVSSDAILNVIINSAPNIPVILGATDICDGDSLLLSTTGTCDSIYWLSPSGNILLGANLSIASDSSAYEAGTWQSFCLDTLTGCETGSSPVNVIIRPKFMPAVTNNGPVCIGSGAILNTNVLLGDYLWFRDSLMTDTIVGATSASVLVSNLQADSTYYVVVTPIGGCSSEPTSTTVTVHPIPLTPALASNLQVCEGSDIVLSTTTSASTYTWSGPNGFASIQASPVIPNADINDAGIYYLVVEDVNGCVSDSAQIVVNIDFIPGSPMIPNVTRVCYNDTLFLAADNTTIGQCDSMAWIGPNGPNYAISGSSASIAPNDTNYIGGLWVLRCIDTTTGCFSTSNTGLVIITPLPDTQATFSNSPVCYGGDAMLSTNVVSTSNAYTWYASLALDTIVGTGPNPVISNMSMDSIFYLVISNNVGCSSAPIATAVTVLPPNNPPTLLADFEVCAGEPIVLTTSTNANAYFWNGPNGFVSNVQNPIVTSTATLNDTGWYSLVVLDSLGCLSASDSVHVTVNGVASPPTINYNGPICEGDILTLSSSGLCGQSQWIGPNGNSTATLGSPGGNNVLWTVGSSTSIPDGNANYLGGDWYMICIDTSTGCQSISDTIVVVINQAPDIIAIVNNGPICIGDTVNLSVSVAPSTSAVTWHTNANLSSGSQFAVGTSTIAFINTTTTFYVRVVDANGCESTDSTTVVVHPVPLAPSLNDITLCEGEDILLTTTTIANGYNWAGPNAYSSNLQNPAAIPANSNTMGTYTLTIVDTNGCESPSNMLLVQVNPLPAAPNVSNTGPVCLGDSINLIVSPIVAGATYEWFHWNTGNSVGLGSPLNLGTVSLADTGIYYVITSMNGCSITSLDSTSINVFGGSIATVFAGFDQDLCGSDSTSLNASPVNSPNTGLWTSASGALIVNPNSPNTTLVNIPIGANTFYWTLTNSNCNVSVVDSVVITVIPIGTDTAFAGFDQNLCGVNTATMTATASLSSTGTWSQTSAQASAGVVINNLNDPNTIISNLQAGNTYSFIWSLSNGICGIYSADTVFVNISNVPNDNAFAGGDIIACGLDTITLNAFNSSLGTGLWTSNSSALIFNDSSYSTDVTNLQQDTTVFVWTLSSGNCGVYSTDTVLVIQGGLAPIANADNFTALAGMTSTFNVLPNDVLTNNWDIYINTPTIDGQLLNLNNGLFDLILQTGDTDNQTFIYELCNPDCPNSCDTGLVNIMVSTIGDCDAPNIFTPNEDGVNDVFEIPCLNVLTDARLLVFNRWGDLVYETDQYENQWNGTHEGKPLPDGTYFYILKVGEEEALQGSVEIRR